MDAGSDAATGAGAALRITRGTVKVHRRNLYDKLEIGSQAEFFGLFVRELMGAVSPTPISLFHAGEQMNRFREFAKADWPFGRGDEGPDFGNRPPHRGHGWGSHAEPDAASGSRDQHPERPGGTAQRAALAARRAALGATLLIITHDPELAEHCDRVVVMHDGKIEER